MSLKRFNADVRSARARLEESEIPGIVSIERGDSEGEVVATFAHEHLAHLLPIRMLAQAVDSYPHENNFLLFTDVDDAPSSITQVLGHLQNYTFGQTVLESIRDLSTALNRALNQAGGDGDATVDAPEDDAEAYDEHDLDGYEDENDDVFGLASDHPSAHQRLPCKIISGVLKKLKQDLRRAREAGAKVGVINGVEYGAPSHIISLSVRANKLGIPDESLEAWDVEPSDYIVLLVRIEEPYPSAEKLLRNPAAFSHLEFRFGKCCRYKPTRKSAQKAFDATPLHSAATGTSKPVEPDDAAFEKLFISNSLEQFMNENFIPLFKLRMTDCSSWDDANARLMDLSLRLPNEALASSSNAGEPRTESKCKGKEPAHALTADRPRMLPSLLLLDSFAEPAEMMSTPLVAMQFATHYFVRCTEYCLRCHRKLDKEFEAMKPFVCSDPLCLFQYITMGFGPSVEHEILTQPYVVDLLVTLCYASTNSAYVSGGLASRMGTSQDVKFPIRDFPTGLRLKVPRVAQSSKDSSSLDAPIPVLVELDHETITLEDPEDIGHLSGGSWMVLQHITRGAAGLTLTHQVYIKYVDRSTNTIQAEIRHKDPLFSALKLTGKTKMDLYGYDAEFDDLDNTGKARAMVSILNTLPPVSHMREYLIRNPQDTLKSCPGVAPAALTLLTWIVASNRSCILQVSQVEDHHATDLGLLKSIKTREQEIIPSLGRHVIQFRFAQGTPDKELRFHRALKELQSQSETQYPTLLAWHGSSLKNWHSILRQGLDFKDTLNGRAYGHGVYFSPWFRTSQEYTHSSGAWPNSTLKASRLIALCEIINSPERFVSSDPHYVVKQLDWIQCRYLLVCQDYLLPSAAAATAVAGQQTSATAGNLTPTGDDQDQTVEIVQDPRRRVKGPDGQDLKIPAKALPSRRSAQRGPKQTGPSTSSYTTKRTRDELEASVETDEDTSDLEAIFSDDDAAQPSSKRSTSTTSRASSMGTAASQKATTQRLSPPSPKTDFRPGSLDLLSLPRLALPQWADTNSTKRLANDIKRLQKVYASTPLHELGWYIDFDNIDNMYRWIVELHTFDSELPLAKDMKNAGVTSIVLEVRFGADYPFSPPFVRVIRPRFLPFMAGGGGHVTIGGALCMELLMSNGWSPATSMEAVFVYIKMAISSTDPRPARLDSVLQPPSSAAAAEDYSASGALDAFERAARTHGWTVPKDARANAMQAYSSAGKDQMG